MAVHHQGDAALRQRANFGNRQRDIIRRHRHRFGVEVTAGNHVVLAGKYQRVVGYRVGFHQQHLRRLAKLGQAGPHHLRLTAQRVRILHLGTVMMRLGNGAVVGQQMAIERRGVNLPALAARFMNARVKRPARSKRRLGG